MTQPAAHIPRAPVRIQRSFTVGKQPMPGAPIPPVLLSYQPEATNATVFILFFAFCGLPRVLRHPAIRNSAALETALVAYSITAKTTN